jgi:hypothetical protein
MSHGHAVYEMFWDCKFCGQKKLLGLTHRFCASCGAPQDPGARYFPPEHEKVAVHAHPFVGADVACPACKQPMSRAAKCCTNCGSPIDRGVEVQRQADVVGPAAHPWGAQGFPPVLQPTPMGMAGASPNAPPKKSNLGLVLGLIGGALALLVVVLLVAVFWKREATFEVTGHAWERNVPIERYELARKSAWCDEVPSAGRVLSRRPEQRSTRQVQDGENCQTRKKDNGDGTYNEVRECTPRYRSEPVMSQRCDYEIAEWRTVRTLSERGASRDDPPRWPAVALGRPGSCLGCEREGPRRASYTVRLVESGSGEEASCEMPEGAWASTSKGAVWKGKVRIMTGGIVCDELVPH